MDFEEVLNSLCAINSLNFATASMNCFPMQRVTFLYTFLNPYKLLISKSSRRASLLAADACTVFLQLKVFPRALAIKNVAASFTRIFPLFLTRFAEAKVSRSLKLCVQSFSGC